MYPTSIYTEMTPNPNTMKFVASRVIYRGFEPVEYKSAAEAEGRSPLGVALYGLSYVRGVFINLNYVTITKSGDLDWDFITFELRELIRQFLLKNEWAAKPEVRPLTVREALNGSNETPKKPPANIPETELDAAIISLLDEHIKPAVSSDGGAIDFVSYNDGVVTVRLRGSCVGCPSINRTLKQGVEKLLTAELAQVKKVVAEEI